MICPLQSFCKWQFLGTQRPLWKIHGKEGIHTVMTSLVVNLTQPRITWGKSLNKRLSGTDWSLSMFVGNCLLFCQQGGVHCKPDTINNKEQHKTWWFSIRNEFLYSKIYFLTENYIHDTICFVKSTLDSLSFNLPFFPLPLPPLNFTCSHLFCFYTVKST